MLDCLKELSMQQPEHCNIHVVEAKTCRGLHVTSNALQIDAQSLRVVD